MIRLHRVSLLFLASFVTGSLLCAAMPAAAGDATSFERARILRVLDLLQPQRGISARPVAAAKRADTAQEGGTITGTVRGLDREGFESAHVVAWQADSISGEDGTVTDGAVAIGRARVEPDGSYRLSGLSPGHYYVSGIAKGYETRYYEDALDLTSATTVEVIEGETVDGVDFELQRFNAGTGSIAGLVISDVDGQPVAGAIVHAFGAENPFSYGVTETDADGAYIIRGLRSGSYVVEAMSPDFLPEFYGDVTAFDEAVLVAVVEPDQTDGIAFSLAVGGAITGVVRNEDGGPIAGAYVSATQPGRFDIEVEEDRVAGPLLPVASGGWAVTDENGAYRLGGLVTGAYRVQAQFSTRWQYVSIWFDGVSTWEQATAVAVVLGETVPAVDMTLEVPVLESGVAGRVTDSNGHPVAGAFVTLQAIGDESLMDSMIAVGDMGPVDSGASSDTQSGDVISSDSGSSGSGSVTVAAVPVDEFLMVSRVWAYATTDEDGRYAIDELPAGTYILSAASENGWEYVHRWYVDADTPRSATRLPLAEGEKLTQIDMVLPVRMATASVSGVVQNQDGEPLARAFVQISTPESARPESARSASGDGPARLWAYAQTDDQGVYRVDRLPAGTYIVHASYHTGDRFGQRWFDGADTPSEATPLVLADDESRPGVDLQLTVRPLYGVVSGVVTDAQTGRAIARAYVELTPANRDAPRDMPVFYGVSTAVTDEAGSFRMPWIPEGIYTMTVYANGGMAHYVHPDTDALSTAIQVVGGETTQHDVALPLRQDGEGAITGSVSLGYPGPMFGLEEPAIDFGIAEGDDIAEGADLSRTSIQAMPEIAVVIAYPASKPGMRYVAVTGPDGTYALRGLPADDFVVMCFAPGHIGTYYDGEYAPDRARPITVEAAGQVDGINFELAGLYRIYTIAEDAAIDGGARAPGDEAATEGVAVFGNVIDDKGQPVVDATVFLLDTQEQPVAFAQTGGDGNFELPTVSPGEYRVYASRLGFTGSYNGNQRNFATAEPLGLEGGQAEVNLVLTAGLITAVEESSSDATPTVMALHRNYPNPFNPETTIRFTVPASGQAVLRIHNALGQRIATLHSDVVEAGRQYEVVFQANDLGSGVYYYVLEFQGQRLTRPMLLMK